VGLRGLEVRITEVPRASSSATLSTWMWYLSAAESGLGTATNWWTSVSGMLHPTGGFTKLEMAETDILEQAQHLVVSGIVWDEESNVGISQYSSDSDQTSPSAGHHADILPRVLAALSLPVVVIVEVSNSLSQRLDTRCGAVFASIHGDWDRSWSWKGAFDLVVDFWSALAEIGPLVRLVEEAMFGSLLGTPVLVSMSCKRQSRSKVPDDTGARTVRVESSMGFVSCMSSELDVRWR
jgi:hypothetical protein